MLFEQSANPLQAAFSASSGVSIRSYGMATRSQTAAEPFTTPR
jgi:hypothetical protein